jgi:hypothetical protein
MPPKLDVDIYYYPAQAQLHSCVVASGACFMKKTNANGHDALDLDQRFPFVITSKDSDFPCHKVCQQSITKAEN